MEWEVQSLEAVEEVDTFAGSADYMQVLADFVVHSIAGSTGRQVAH